MAKIEVKKKPGLLVWLEKAEAGRNSALTVPEGCQAIVVCDGAIERVVYPGSEIINVRKLLGKGTGNSWKVYGVNTSEKLELPWGVQVKYTEERFKIPIKLKVAGLCNAYIENGSYIFKKLRGGRENIDADTIADFFRDGIINAAEACVASAACREMDETKIRGLKNEIAAAIRKDLAAQLSGFGLRIESIDVRFNEFEGLEEFDERLRDIALGRLEAEAAELSGKRKKAEAEGDKAVAEAAKAAAEAINAFGPNPQQARKGE